MRLFKKKTVTKTYDKENKKPVIKASICNGEQVAGFKNIHTGKIDEVMLIKNQADLDVFKKMSPAVAVALFTKSSAGTLPVTMASAEQNMKVNKAVSRFVLPICTTINMNGCAAFILITSIFVMQNAGFELSMTTMLTWLLVSVLAAVGNAGVPMGCYFLTLSLMSGIGAPIGIMGIILPIYTIIDMVETAENVWSDSCVCAMTDHDLKGKIAEEE